MNRADAGTRWVARDTYTKGKTFIAAALLLRGEGGHEYVALHLLCQGTENILKSLLLLADYGRFNLKVLKRRFGHHLVKVAGAAAAEFGARARSGQLKVELEQLDRLYSEQLLRYGSVVDILLDPRSVESARVLRGVLDIVKYVERRRLFCPAP